MKSRTINFKKLFVLMCFASNMGMIACQKNLAESWKAQDSSSLTLEQEPVTDDTNNPLDPDKGKDLPPNAGNPSDGEKPPKNGGEPPKARQYPPLCNDNGGPELSISNVAMSLDRSEIVYEDGAVLSVPTAGGMGSVDLYELSQNVLDALRIDRSLISGGVKVQEIRIYFRNDNNYIYNSQGNPVCRWVPESVGAASLVVNVNATPFQINKAKRLSFALGACDLKLLADGDCSLRKTYQAILE